MHTRTGVVMCSPWIANRHKAALLMQEPIRSERLLVSVGKVGSSIANVRITTSRRVDVTGSARLLFFKKSEPYHYSKGLRGPLCMRKQVKKN